MLRAALAASAVSRPDGKTTTVIGIKNADNSLKEISNSALPVIRQQTNDFIGAKQKRKPQPLPPILPTTGYFIIHINWSQFNQDSYRFNYNKSELIGVAGGGPGQATMYHWNMSRTQIILAKSLAISYWASVFAQGEPVFFVPSAEKIVFDNRVFKQKGVKPAKLDYEEGSDDEPLLEYVPVTSFATDSDSILYFGYIKNETAFVKGYSRVVWRGGQQSEDRSIKVPWREVEYEPDPR